MEFVSLLGLLLPTSLSSHSVFFSSSDLSVIILRALGENMRSVAMWWPLTSPLPDLYSALLMAFTILLAVTGVLVATSVGVTAAPP